jgi:hypothetical protein
MDAITAPAVGRRVPGRRRTERKAPEATGFTLQQVKVTGVRAGTAHGHDERTMAHQ